MNQTGIQALYPVSPVQEDLIFAGRNGLETTPAGQLSCRLKGKLDIRAFERTWQVIVDRHAILRTSFVWERIDKPHQIVSREAAISLEQHDWSNLSAAKRQSVLHKYRRSERNLVSDPSQPSLVRFSLIRMKRDEFFFVWSYHNILLDERSVALLWEEAVRVYRELKEGNEPAIEPAAPYKEYIAWLRKQESAEAAKFWQARLDGVDRDRALKGLSLRQAAASDRPEDIKEELHPLSSESTAALRCATEAHGLKAETVLVGAWALLLTHYTGEDEAAFGVSYPGRPKELSLADIAIGPFRNTLPNRVRIPNEASLLTWLKEIQDQASSVVRYQHSSLSEVRAWTDVPAEVELFDSVVDLDGHPASSLSSFHPDLEFSQLELNRRTDCGFTLRLLNEPEPVLQVIYNTRAFDDFDVKQLLSQLDDLFREIGRDFGGRISSVALGTEVERHHLLFELNDTGLEVSGYNTVKLFETQVEARPDAIAVGCEDQHLSYDGLNHRGNQLGRYLQSLGVGPDVRVCICTERSVEMIVGLVGILKAGGAYVPLDPSYPIERLSFMLEDSRSSVLLTQERVLDELPSLWTQVICLDSDQEQILRHSSENPTSEGSAQNLAYVIYTSGSTGRPKGVQITHQGLVNLVSWHERQYRVTPDDRATQLAGVSFDASAWELWPYLLSGASLHLPDQYTRSTPIALRDWLISAEITISFLPTPLAEALLDLDWPQSVALRCMLTGGDKLHHHPPARIPFPVVNNYGPTENAVVTTSGLVPTHDGPSPARVPSIGRPIANARVHVLDGKLNPTPFGRVGELHIGGGSLTRGYLNRPDLTAEKLIPDPFDQEGGKQLYRSGDLVRYRNDGQIDFIGRVDHQVKIRGYRIELGEIESTLMQQPDISDAAVVVREDAPGDQQLVAYIVIRQPATQPLKDLRRLLQGKLPDYMIPSAFVVLDALPVTAHGKVDRRSLPSPDESRQDPEDEFVAPRTAEERTLAAIWIEVLGLDRVGLHDNFFRIGGDSILAVQIIARANQAGLKLSTKQLFLYPTVGELASVAGIGSARQAEQGHVVGPVKLSPIQRWFFEREFQDPEHYNQAIMLEVREIWPSAIFEGAIGQLVSHHDALRLRFRIGPSGWEQFNAAFTHDLSFGEIDLSALADEKQKRAMEIVSTDLQRSLNLSEGPLVRGALFVLGGDQPARLFIVIHHLAVDGVSWRILVEDLHTACRQLSGGHPVELPPKTTSFQAWAERLADYATSEELRQEIDYWTAGASREVTGGLPIDYVGGRNTVSSLRNISVSLSAEQTQALVQEVPEAYHTEINDVLLTALLEAFRQFTGQSTLSIDLEGHGREDLFDDADVSRTVGWFTSIFPVYLELPDGHSLGNSLKSVKEQLRRIPNRGIGYGLLRYSGGDLEAQDRLRVLPRAEISFNYLGQFDQMLAKSEGFDLAGELIGSNCSLQAERPHLIEVTASIVGRQLHVSLSYSQNVHHQSTIEALARGYLDSLQLIINHCRSAESGDYTASDVSEFGWNQEDLNDIVAAINKQL